MRCNHVFVQKNENDSDKVYCSICGVASIIVHKDDKSTTYTMSESEGVPTTTTGGDYGCGCGAESVFSDDGLTEYCGGCGAIRAILE